MNIDPHAAWAAVVASPLFGTGLTLLVYQAAMLLYERTGRHPLLSPVLVTVAVIIAILLATGVPYATYFDGARLVYLLLGPATVALAVPLYRQIPALIRAWPAVLAGIIAGSAVAMASAVLIARWLGAATTTQLSLAPKSVTTPIAMAVSEHIGGDPALTAVLVILTGVFGAVVGGWVLDLGRVRSPAARGLALGTAAHAFGTTRALQEGETQGAFAGLAIGLAGIVTAVLTPLMIGWLASPR